MTNNNIKNKSFRNQQLKLTIIVLICLLIIFLIIGNLFIRKKIIHYSINEIKTTSEKFINKFNNEVQSAVSLTKTLSQTLASLTDPANNLKIERNQAITILQNILAQNHKITDIYMVWEPDAFDRSDSKYKSSENHDSTGRFAQIISKKKSEKGIQIDVLSNYNDFYEGKYYAAIKSKQDVTILNPVVNRTLGKTEIKLNIIAPILQNNKFLGGIGINISIDNIQTIINQTSKNTGIDYLLINDDGTIMASSYKPIYTGKQIHELFIEQFDLIQNLKTNNQFVYYIDNLIFVATPYNLAETEKFYNLCFYFESKKIDDEANKYFLIYAILLFVIFTVVFLIILKHIEKLNSVFQYLIKFTNFLKKGSNKKPETKIPQNDEIVTLENNLNEISNIYNELIQIHSKITQGDYHQILQTDDNENMIAASVNQMTTSLKTLKEKTEQKQREEDIIAWTRQGIAKLSESLRQSAKTIEELADNIIQSLVEYTDACLGGIFLVNNSNSADVHLETIATYAYDKKKLVIKKIKFGEGIIGTCAVEKKPILIHHLPENYIEIASGLGGSQPKTLFVLPLNFENQFLGVIEIAFIRKIAEFEKLFIEQITENIASTLSSARMNLVTVQLLEQSQKQAEELTTKEAILRQNIDQLNLTQQEILKREAEMRGILNAVNHTIMTIEYTTEGILLTANDKYLSTMHYTLQELQGVNVLDLVKTERTELENVIKMVAEGKYYQKEMKRFTKFGDVRWLLSTYTPFYDISGKVTKILYFAYDITESKLQAEALQNKEKELLENLETLSKTQLKSQLKEAEMKGILDAVNNTLMTIEYTTEGILLTANDKYLNAMGYQLNDIQGINVLDLVKTEREELEKVIKMVAEGKFYQKVMKRFTKKGEARWLLSTYTPFYNLEGIVSKILYFAYDITESKMQAEALEAKEQLLLKSLEDMQQAQDGAVDIMKQQRETIENLYEKIRNMENQIKELAKKK